MSEPSEESYDSPVVASLADHRRNIGNKTKPPGPLKPTGGGGTSDGMDAWQQSIEDRLAAAGKRIDTNLLWLLAAMGAGFIFLITRLDGVEARLGQKIEKVGDQVSAMSADMAVLKIGQQPVIPPKPKP